ncbi:MAG: FlaD/FlaE family flagellar protein [Nanopusillaceae archaeon]
MFIYNFMIFNIFRKDKTEKEENPQITQPIQNLYQDQIKNLVDSLSSLSKSVKIIEGRLQEFSEKFNSIETKTQSYENEVNNLKSYLEKMIAVYDLISKQYNPFIEEEPTIPQEVSYFSEEVKNSGVLPLDEIKNDPAIITIILGWLNYLVKKAGIEETEKTLDYYESVGWISENAKIKLLEYLKGFENVESKKEKITVEDHIITLYIITKIKNVDQEKIYKIKDLYDELVKKGIIKPSNLK